MPRDPEPALLVSTWSDKDPNLITDEARGAHHHTDKTGLVHNCYHVCKSRWYIWLPIIFTFQVLMFPLEHSAAHAVWQLPGFEKIAETMGWTEFTGGK